LNTQLRLNGDNQVRAMDRRDRLERQWADLAVAAPAPAAIALEPGRPPVPPEVMKMRQQVEELRRKYTDRYPEVIQARAELAELERQLAEPVEPKPASAKNAQEPAVVDPRTRLLQAVADADAELAALKTEEAAFRQAIRSYEDRVENVPKRQEEFEQLSRDTATTKERYETLLKRYEEAQLASSLERGQKVEQFRILDPAIPPREASAPSRVRLAAIGLFLALAAAVGSVLLIEKLDTAFHSITDLREFVSVPTLFSIPLILTTAETRRRRRRAAFAAVSVAVGLALVISGSRYVARDNDSLVRLTAGTRG
jgi:succinoglycan biosynthesis transport protein ExoP